MAKYALGMDFGTLSARALIAEIGTGRELSTAVMDYPHGVMDRALPCGSLLPPDWALQHPEDYLACMEVIVPEAVKKAGIDPADIIGIGLDITSNTVLPVDPAGVPLCLKEEFASERHAWPKLWKHHAAQAEADRMTAVAQERNESFLGRYGGKISSEWMFPKLWQVLNEAPSIYVATDRFMEAGDWLVYRLTGRFTQNSCMAGYKALWSKTEGFPSKAYLAALDPRLENVVEEKLRDPVLPIGSKAGELTEEAASLLGLKQGTAVAVANIDAHVSMPPTGITQTGAMVMIMGTSTCDIMLGDTECIVPGMCGAVEDGIIPGFIGYEAGQSCVGDHFGWFVNSLLPEDYAREARDKGMNAHELLTEKAAKLKPGESGLITLDWWNGNRSVLVDADLTGLLIGMTLQTKAEEIYRALIEATAYGARKIIETFEQNGVPVRSLCACGGIAQKNALLMQIYADVTGREIRIARSKQTPALGSAMFGAVAAGSVNGGYDSIAQAAREMGGTLDTVYRPIAENVACYDRLYAEYSALHDLFGRANDCMKRLKKIRTEQSGK